MKLKFKSVNEIRKSYLDFFASKDHYVSPSFPLVPINDNSLLLINAGMAPLKNYFMGIEKPPKNRMSTCQKCIRTGDIENVGITARHATFFEMLGNFSFGNYFKNEAIAWAWEFVTTVLEISPELLWVTVYEEDDEAYNIWRDKIGVSEDRIVRLGKEDNFWEIGTGTGPCGPCSEIYIDRGAEFGCDDEHCKPGCDCDRFLEFWNLVFTQFNKEEDKTLTPLPHPNIDTGMGLERVACMLQGVDSIFDIDTMQDIIRKIEELLHVKYREDSKKDISIRIITDHIRAVTFLIGDGVIPSNEGRGYVLRRLLRRAARHGKLLGMDRPFLHELMSKVIEINADAYPELKEKQEYIYKVIKVEEEKFEETIYQGLEILREEMNRMKEVNETMMSPEKAFRLYDTFGFPFDLTKEILTEEGFSVEEEGFYQEMEKQRNRARSARKDSDNEGWNKENISLDLEPTVFEGYTSFTEEASIISIVQEDSLIQTAKKGDKAIFILNRTPFYAESGGQVGDIGILESQRGKVSVLQTKKGNNDVIMHIGEVIEGEISVGDSMIAEINESRRNETMRNHSATHLLHKALRTVLGNHVTQAGSFVTPERVRFDFTHFEAMTKEELQKVELAVNGAIYSYLEVTCQEMAIEKAKEKGAMALFGEKYGQTVRVVSMGDYSVELCGGTHVSNTSEIGMFKIVSESGVASGVRRIEAVTGMKVYEVLKKQEVLLEDLSEKMKTKQDQLSERVEHQIVELKEAKKEIAQLKNTILQENMDNIMSHCIDVSDLKLLTNEFENVDSDDLRNIAQSLVDKDDTLVVVLASKKDEKINFIAMAGKNAVEKGAHCGNLLREVAKIAKGGGGGKANMAQAGGKDVSKIKDALNVAKDVLIAQLL